MIRKEMESGRHSETKSSEKKKMRMCGFSKWHLVDDDVSGDGIDSMFDELFIMKYIPSYLAYAKD